MFGFGGSFWGGEMWIVKDSEAEIDICAINTRQSVEEQKSSVSRTRKWSVDNSPFDKRALR